MTASTPSPGGPFVMACLGIATFAGMDAVMKGLAIGMGTYNTLLWRTGTAVAITALLYLWHRPPWPQSEVMRLHVWRGLVTSVMAFLFFWGLKYVPLAEAIGLSFIAPLIALYLAAVLLGEKVGSKSVMASLLGFSGALVIIAGRLGADYGEQVGLGIAAILLSALMYAYNLILQRRQAIVAGPVEIVFFQNCTVFSVYLLFAPFMAELPPPRFVPEILAAASLAIVSVLMLSWAYARAEARILIPVEYTAFIWAAILGWLMFGESLSAASLAGTALIVTGCLLAARQHRERVEHVETTAV